MPEYSYICDEDNEGCGHYFTVFQKLSEYKLLKRCPSCKKHRLRRAYEDDIAYGSVKKSDGAITIGHLADRTSNQSDIKNMTETQKKNYIRTGNKNG